ncbi:unnamed protein product [Acanthoscelides obtectus]|uniref:Uncharacterized protein n=1 Tax=Acanthoscelides obtectus TaxID=200917 RepID=A0A9P0P3I1_ACAOB|nr:unnamed protein product [Acanthoscelides obtectus]CAK1653972.1 hypothetical protein AOBTE_LOCUS18411 [Acanthoscelides obtectus]
MFVLFQVCMGPFTCLTEKDSAMDDDVQVAAIASFSSSFDNEKEVKPWIARRELKRIYNNLVQELAVEDQRSYVNFLRMDEDETPSALRSGSW